MATYIAVMTEIGRIKLASAAANNSTLDITHMALGDGAGAAVDTPTGYEQSLVNEVYRNTLNSLVDQGAQFTADMIIAPDVGGWIVREMGLIDSAGDLVAYANTPAIEKALISDGAPIEFVPTITVEVESPDSVTVIINPAIITASRLWVDENYLAKSRNLADIADKAQARINLGAGQASGLATLDENGLVPQAQMPPQRLSKVFTAVDEAAMLSLTAVQGDVAIRLDESKTYILSIEPANVLANWVAMESNTIVISVAGKTGTVTLEKADVGLDQVDNTADADKPVSTAQAQAILNANVNVKEYINVRIQNLAKADVGLDQVDNTADADKPVSNAQESAINTAKNAVQTNLDNHENNKNAHGATPASTANAFMRRDAAGRAQVESPSAAKDIVNKEYIDKRAATHNAFGGIKVRFANGVLHIRTDSSNA